MLRTSWRRLLLLPSIVGAVPVQVGAQAPWSLVACSAAEDAAAVEFEEAVRAAPADSTVHLPFPFPSTIVAAAQDFSSQYLESWSQQDEDFVPPDEQALLALVREGHARYELLLVANWLPHRCNLQRGTREKSLLLRVFDDREDSNLEVARIVLDESGLLDLIQIATPDPSSEGSWLPLRSSDGHDFSPLEEADVIAREYGLSATDLQWVALASPGGADCPELSPCTVFRQEARVFLYRSGRVFEFAFPAVLFDRRDFVVDGAARDAILGDLHEADEIVSLGGTTMTVVRPLPRPSVP